jgi:uncharacterized protein with von Willebrand factor type A (vWA) domain
VTDSRIVDNIILFGRTLRAAGLPIGPGRVIDAIRAVESVGIGSRDDLYWTLHAVFVNRQDQRGIFDQAFHIFWRNPHLLDRLMAAMLPQIAVPRDEQSLPEEMIRRLAEALARDRGEKDTGDVEDEIEFDAAMTWSDRELLQTMDFEKMSAKEVEEAKRIISTMQLPIMDLPVRRFRTDPRGRRVDMRATLRAALRSGRDIPLRFRRRQRRHPPLVIMCDVSGSMARYARLFVHFMHAITNDRDRVHTFVFGTRLTNITRDLRHRDIDIALDRVGERVEDWAGGTRIGHCLESFNNHWSRRVLGQGAVVMLITDGLDRDAATDLGRQMERLHKSCRRLIWLNPLLRFEGYEPKAGGARAILPHVDDFRPIHNLESMRDLASVLGQPGPRRLEAARTWVPAAA